VGHHGVTKSGIGYKDVRNLGKNTTNLDEIGASIADAFQDFATEHRWELRLEIEPGMYLVANASALITTIQDKVSFLQMA
jgi:diaminopimelate decarboxylase